MAEFFGSVYEPPNDSLPLVAVILDGKMNVKIAVAVESVEDGEERIARALLELKKLAEADAARGRGDS